VTIPDPTKDPTLAGAVDLNFPSARAARDFLTQVLNTRATACVMVARTPDGQTICLGSSPGDGPPDALLGLLIRAQHIIVSLSQRQVPEPVDVGNEASSAAEAEGQ